MPHDTDDTATTSAVPLYRAPRELGPWSSHHLWYQAKPHEVHNTDVALGLIAECARLGMHILTLPAIPADGDPDYVEKVMRRASRRGMRIFPNVGGDVFEEHGATGLSYAERCALLEEWFAHGAHGVELGTFDLSTTTDINEQGRHVHAGWEVGELMDFVHASHPDALVSVNLQANTFDEIKEHLASDAVDVVRFEVTGAPGLEAENYYEQTAANFELFEAAGTIPSWNCSFATLERAATQLSEGAVLLANSFFPGFLNFEQNIPGHSPSVRHGLRMRDSLGLNRANILLDAELAHDGFIWLVTDNVRMLLNFGPYPYHVPNDGRVLISSLIELPQEGDHLIVPPGEAAWIRR
ncbi:hypothetical protein [Trueperella pecoris]|uniref:Uncharacterized protein n=1 Tax=Trueperella pecoris TaxID=2733571 RepID=A0A7M1QWZ5_9ACTO|nr:hypothetical protein [Trueperella pecoris]QOR46383.1 hypothetical protein INS88_04050 [Trueperella pecoris]